ncbi:hypothetical protein BOX15_Mlig029663g1, partial [Macrostomum lignano]
SLHGIATRVTLHVARRPPRRAAMRRCPLVCAVVRRCAPVRRCALLWRAGAPLCAVVRRCVPKKGLCAPEFSDQTATFLTMVDVKRLFSCFYFP